MFLIDDVLLFPIHGVLAIFREVQAAAEQEIASEADAIRARLGELYMMLETGRLTEAEFDDQERELLDRLDAIEARAAGGEAASGEAGAAAAGAPGRPEPVLGSAE